jgi:hypothetical protein
MGCTRKPVALTYLDVARCNVGCDEEFFLILELV